MAVVAPTNNFAEFKLISGTPFVSSETKAPPPAYHISPAPKMRRPKTGTTGHRATGINTGRHNKEETREAFYPLPHLDSTSALRTMAASPNLSHKLCPQKQEQERAFFMPEARATATTKKRIVVACVLSS